MKTFRVRYSEEKETFVQAESENEAYQEFMNGNWDEGEYVSGSTEYLGIVEG